MLRQEEDIDEFIAAELSCVNVAPVRISSRPQCISARVLPFGFGEDIAEEAEEPEQAEDLLPEGGSDSERILGPEYSEESQQYAVFLTTLKRPPGLQGKQYRKFKIEALKFIIQDNYLFRRASKNISLRRVINKVKD